MSLFKFSKPKNPGFGISSEFYLSVLAAKAQLPTIRQIIRPKGEDGAVAGFGAPLGKDATKDDLDRPLVRGVYAMASPDRKTVVQMMVVSKEEAGFDPEAVSRNAKLLEVDDETIGRIRATWTLLQLRFESHDAKVFPATDFALRLADRLALLTDGVVADPLARRYLLPGKVVLNKEPHESFSVNEHVQVAVRSSGQNWSVNSHGLSKFSLPEIELNGVSESNLILARDLIYSINYRVLGGELLELGMEVGARKTPFQVASGGLDRARWEGIACVELIPERGRTVDETLLAWQLEYGR